MQQQGYNVQSLPLALPLLKYLQAYVQLLYCVCMLQKFLLASFNRCQTSCSIDLHISFNMHLGKSQACIAEAEHFLLQQGNKLVWGRKRKLA